MPQAYEPMKIFCGACERPFGAYETACPHCPGLRGGR